MSLAQIILRKFPKPRNNLCYNSVTKTIVCQKSTQDPKDTSSSSSSGSSSSDSDGDVKKRTSKDEAVSKLNTLLQQMVSDKASSAESRIKLAQPTNKREIGRKEKETVRTESVEKQVVNAVKNVAETLGGNTKQTESELLMKLLNPTERFDGTSNNLSDILKGMKIEREVKPRQSKADQVRTVLQKFSSKSKTHDRPTEQKRPKRLSVPVTEEG